MKPRDTVLAQLAHCETAAVPYTLAYETDVGMRLDEYFGAQFAGTQRGARLVCPTRCRQ